MIATIEARYISAVFVKDFSRLGLDYIEVGKLTEEFFSLHDVQLMAVSDGVDSDKGEDDFTLFKNIMNKYYAKDISKKRRIVNKMKGNAGILFSPPPYGYMKDLDDPRFGSLARRLPKWCAAFTDWLWRATAPCRSPRRCGQWGRRTTRPIDPAREALKARQNLPSGTAPPSQKSSPCRNTAAM